MTPPGDRRRGITRRVLDPVGTDGPSKRIGEATAVNTTAPAARERRRWAQWSNEVARRRRPQAIGAKSGGQPREGSVRHKGARSDPRHVLSGARVDRWRASSGQTPSFVTVAESRSDGGVRLRRPEMEKCVVMPCSKQESDGEKERLQAIS